MSLGSKIPWTDGTFNPWWGCARVSPACRSCYADTWAKRVGEADLWHRGGRRRTFGEKHWREPLRWNQLAEERGKPYLIFCASMADVFEDHSALPPERERLWKLIEETPWLTWQLLTKRPENVLAMVPPAWRDAWPPQVWIGTSVENQYWAKVRVPYLLEIPAATRFLSAEPVLGPMNLNWLEWSGNDRADHNDVLRWGVWGAFFSTEPRVHWLIVGGESGKDARRMDPAWARRLLRQGREGRAAVFMKQLGSALARELGCRDLKGEDPDEWPEDLRIRELPQVAVPA